jgi:N6-adenosine-specific RNA methylase IME4
MKFNLIVADCPFSFSDGLTMSEVKRGAASQYPTLTDQDLVGLDVKSLSANDAVLVLWVPSSKLQLGLDIMKEWGFRQTQTFVWVKIKKDPFKDLKKSIKGLIKTTLLTEKKPLISGITKPINDVLDLFNYNTIVSMFLGRWFRQCHEIALIGIRGKIYQYLDDKSQRSVMFSQNLKHSSKPDELQKRLEVMLPYKDGNRYLELFARRQRENWICVGDESEGPFNGDIRDDIEKLKKL